MERGGRLNGGDYFNQVDRSAVSPPPSGGAAAGDGNVSVGVGGGGVNYIEHPVSKLDTLAGVAIRYGVEIRSESYRLSCIVMTNNLIQIMGPLFGLVKQV